MEGKRRSMTRQVVPSRTACRCVDRNVYLQLFGWSFVSTRKGPRDAAVLPATRDIPRRKTAAPVYSALSAESTAHRRSREWQRVAHRPAAGHARHRPSWIMRINIPVRSRRLCPSDPAVALHSAASDPGVRSESVSRPPRRQRHLCCEHDTHRPSVHA